MPVIQLAHEASQDRPHAIRVTTLVERDFQARGVFPDLRRQFAAEVIYQGNAAVFYVSDDELTELLDDAKGRNASGSLKRAFTAFGNQLAELVRELKTAGAVPDPGIDAIRAALSDSPARFNVGDAALVLSDDGSTELVEIVDGYRLYCIRSRDGEYIDKDGERITYQFGYVAKASGEPRLFWPAHRLIDVNLKTRHLVRAV